MIALSFAPNSSYIKKKRHLDPNDRKELRGFIIFRAAIRNCELIPHFPFKTYLDISLRRVSIIAIGHFSSFLRIWYQWKGLKINLVSLFNFLCILQTYHPMVRHFILGSCAAKSYGCNISPDVDEEDKEQGNGTPGWKLIVTSWKSQAIDFPIFRKSRVLRRATINTPVIWLVEIFYDEEFVPVFEDFEQHP